MTQNVTFANMEIELESTSSLTLLLEEVREQISVHYHGQLESGNDFASFALEDPKSGVDWTVDQSLSAFCAFAEKLSPTAEKIWRACVRRELDLGFESGDASIIYEGRIETETLRRIGELGATVEITIYPVSGQRDR